MFSPIQRELEEAWGVKVFDRYSVVLHIFRCNAKTKEAKLQISLAEIPLLRSAVTSTATFYSNVNFIMFEK